MKKSSFVAMMLGTVSGVLFALGMCMALLPEWNAFKPGIVFGAVGIILGLITVIVWRKMEHKAPIKLNGQNDCTNRVRNNRSFDFGCWYVLLHGLGKYYLCTIIGLVGILLLLSLIPFTKGIK